MVAPPATAAGPFSADHAGPSGVAVLTMSGTATGNAMGASVWSRLPEAVATLEADDTIRSVVLRGAAECFSVGMDLRWYLTHYRRMTRDDPSGPRLRAKLLAEARQMQGALMAVANSPMPFVAAVHGACVGTGLELAAACDIRLASEDAFFSLPEARLGIVADLGSLQRLPHLIGAGPAREMALTGRVMSASEAHARGLVTTIVPTPAELFDAATTVAAQLAACSPHVVAGVKQAFQHAQAEPDTEGMRLSAVWNSAFMVSEELPDLLAEAIRR